MTIQMVKRDRIVPAQGTLIAGIATELTKSLNKDS